MATANGTIFDATTKPGPPIDIGDALLKLQPTASSPGLSVYDWWAPSNVLTYQGPDGEGLCLNDMDVASGGVLLPTGFTYTGSPGGCGSGCSVVINADKQSNIYVANQNDLGGYSATGGNNVETVLTPCVYNNGPNGNCVPAPPSQGYWASPAYWFDGPDSIYWLYYSATMNITYPPSGA